MEEHNESIESVSHTAVYQHTRDMSFFFEKLKRHHRSSTSLLKIYTLHHFVPNYPSQPPPWRNQ